MPKSPPVQATKRQDTRRNEVLFPQGELSFSDAVVEYKVGDPAPKPAQTHAEQAVGIPDCPRDPCSVTLGRGGSLTMRFVDNALVDVEGPDLYVFEEGPDVEATTIELSEDGVHWIAAGRVDGSLSQLDIKDFVKPEQVFRYVRVTDDPDQGERSGVYVGADIDAMGAIGSVERIELPGALLFDIDRAVLKPEAVRELNRAVARIRAYGDASVTVEGHTDNTGTEAHNRELSKERAQAVSDYLVYKQIARSRVTTRGYAATRPVESNDSPGGRQQNRRVEILVRPSKR